jgi:hypothetical protein
MNWHQKTDSTQAVAGKQSDVQTGSAAVDLIWGKVKEEAGGVRD